MKTWYHWDRVGRGFHTRASDTYPKGAPRGFWHRTKRMALEISVIKAETAIDDLRMKIIEAKIAISSLPKRRGK